MDPINWSILQSLWGVRKIATKPKSEGGLGMTNSEFNSEVAKQGKEDTKKAIKESLPDVPSWVKNLKWAVLGLAVFYVFRITKK